MKTYLVSKYFTFGVVIKVSVTFKSTLYDFAEFLSKDVVIKEVVNAEAGSGCFPGVGRANTLLSGSNTLAGVSHHEIRRIIKTNLAPPNSTSFNPSTIW
jgi:hypothetical protein